MPAIPRYLITTADERTWKFDRPVVFLGEWCRLYDRKHIWHGMDAIVMAPYGLGQAKKDADNVEARALEENLFPILCEALNQHHGTQHGGRFWRIVLGHWLRRYVDVMINRVKTLEQCLHKYSITGITGYANYHYKLAPHNSYEAIWAFNDDRWNNILTIRILDLLGVENCPVELLESDEAEGFCFNTVTTPSTLKRKILKWGYLQIGKLARCLARGSDAFIINSYLPKKEAIKLYLALRQCPQLIVSPKYEMSQKTDLVLRKSLSEKFVNKSGNNLEEILSVMLFELLPACYLEGFTNLNKLVKQQSWPKYPKFIFTSNNFDGDEVFKLYTAYKVENGRKYFAGQHGNYGVYRNHNNPSNEEITADNFLTWGWTDGLPQHTPAFIFKLAGRNSENYNSLGGVLLIELYLQHRLTTWDGTAEFGKYFEEQQDFINKLGNSPRQNLTIRLHAQHRSHRWNEEARWEAFDPTLKIDAGVMSIKELISQSRLVVHSYDSTGILETLAQNIPTLAFWQNGFEHLRDSAKPYYQLLVDAEIVHLTPESVAQKVNDVWDDVDGWWEQRKVQDAVKQFCDRYARQSRYPIRDLKKMLS
jgi:putative transferase (TIGR04331 family)